MAISTAAIAIAVVRPAISIIRRTRIISAACSGVGSENSIWLMQGPSDHSGGGLPGNVPGHEGVSRLDCGLAAHLADLSRSRLKALILDGKVAIGRAPVRDPAYHVTVGDTITIDLPEAVDAEPAGEAMALDIVYEDDDIIVI